LTSLKRGQKPASADLGLGILILLLQLSVAEVQASSIQAIKLVCMLVAADHLAPPAILVSYPKVSDLVHGFPSLLLLGVLLQDIDDAVEICGFGLSCVPGINVIREHSQSSCDVAACQTVLESVFR